jgi:PKHD-type hydroxylase
MRSVVKTPCMCRSGAIPDEVCDMIIKQGKELKPKEATVFRDKGLAQDLKLRKGNVSFFNKESWVDPMLQGHVISANLASGWGFRVDGGERVQFADYCDGAFYDWHRDCNDNPGGVYRKLSVTVQLSAPGDYEGGDFHLRDLYNKKDITLKGTRDRGTIIVFPSILLHRVAPVTEGHRYSLVQWYNGPDFV